MIAKYILRILVYHIIIVSVSSCNENKAESSRRNLFDLNWKFNEAGTTASRVDFNDAYWQDVDLPYNLSANYSSKVGNTGKALNKTSWYRKHFEIPKAWLNKNIFLEFEGISKGSNIYVNGMLLEQSEFEANACRVLISPYLSGSISNVIAVSVNMAGDNLIEGREEYEVGIYNHVWLIIEER